MRCKGNVTIKHIIDVVCKYETDKEKANKLEYYNKNTSKYAELYSHYEKILERKRKGLW